MRVNTVKYLSGIFLICLLVFMLGFQPGIIVADSDKDEPSKSKPPEPPNLDALLDIGLKAAGMTRKDFFIKRDIGGEIDPFRLDVVNECLEKPFETGRISRELTDSLLADGKPKSDESLAWKGAGQIWNKVDEFFIEASPQGFREMRASLENEAVFNSLAPEIRRTVFASVKAAAHLKRPFSGLRNPFKVQELAHLNGFFHQLFARESNAAADYNKIEESVPEVHDLTFYLGLFQHLDEEALNYMVALTFSRYFGDRKEKDDSIRDDSENKNPATPVTFVGAAKLMKKLLADKKASDMDKNLPFIFDTEHGKIKITGTGDDIHTDTAECLLIIDLGGNDIYKGRPAGGVNGVSFIFDLAGDDVYIADEECALGSGFWGVGVLYDFAGDDVYRGREMSCGVGICGYGLLRDVAGNDTYISEDTAQGAGCFGIGMLVDEAGNDTYTAPLFAQGFSLVKGYGLLLDGGGNDSYNVGGKYEDHREPGQAYQSMGQGFAYGLRPSASGGIAVLYDVGGNDTYTGDYFCQGSSYWHAFGILRDDAGNDTYRARRYSQGAGIHLSAGCLMDKSGNDTYVSWGVSQGCGHDYAVGYFIDEKGNDSSSTDWMCNGTGNASGIGIHFDLSGDDRYTTRGNNQLGGGIWDKGRKGPSMGVFIDVRGKDFYSKSGRDKHVWFSGECGVGIDGE